jgi:hypothetical protein
MIGLTLEKGKHLLAALRGERSKGRLSTWLDFPQFTLRGKESPRIDLASEPVFPRFRRAAETRINAAAPKARAGQQRPRR